MDIEQLRESFILSVAERLANKYNFNYVNEYFDNDIRDTINNIRVTFDDFKVIVSDNKLDTLEGYFFLKNASSIVSYYKLARDGYDALKFIHVRGIRTDKDTYALCARGTTFNNFSTFFAIDEILKSPHYAFQDTFEESVLAISRFESPEYLTAEEDIYFDIQSAELLNAIEKASKNMEKKLNSNLNR